MSKSKWLAAMVALTLLGGVSASAEGEVYTLNPIVVTAQRMEKTELNTPVTETVVSEQKIEDAGYKNVFDAIENQVGLSSTGYGDAGQDFGFSAGRTVIRGYDRGTLVMVDGIPMNLKNYNSLDGIPIDAVKKIEVIKGASGTLYGAEAMGGVINIITKRPGEGQDYVKVKGTVGNYYNDFGVTYSGNRFLVSLQREFSDAIDHANAYPSWSSYDWRVGKGQKNRAVISANITDEISANFMYQNGNVTRWAENKKAKNNYRYDDRRMTAGLFYKGETNGIKATIGYNFRDVNGKDFAKPGYKLASAAKLNSWIADVQKTWTFDKDTMIVGYTFKREGYEGYNNKIDGHRQNNAIYLSYDHAFTDKFSATLGLRGEFIDDVIQNENVFTPQLQTLYKINKDTSWYINIGRAFQMPTVDDELKYKASTGLGPEKGWTYETGVKKLIGDSSSLKLAVYHMDFENKIGWRHPADDPINYEAYNKGNFKNTGVEVEFASEINDHWDYSFGVGFSNPKVKDPSVKNPKWVQDSAKVDATASITYRADKLRSTLSYKYLGDRESYSKYGQVPSRSRFIWNTIYDVTKNDSFELTFNNLFDHDNFANKYGNLELPFNWRLSYSHKF